MCSQNAETENRKNTVEKSWLNIKHKKTECRNRKQKEYGGKKVTLHSAQQGVPKCTKVKKSQGTVGKVCMQLYITKPMQKDLEFSRQNCGAADFLKFLGF